MKSYRPHLHSIRFFLTGIFFAGIFFSLFPPRSACGWGEKAAERITEEALSRLSPRLEDFLSTERKYFSSGLHTSAETRNRYAGFSSFDTTGFAANALARRLETLRSLFSEDKGPYMSYRMGLLADLVIDLNFPPIPADQSIRRTFAADIDQTIAGFRYRPRPSRIIADPVEYFSRAIERSSSWVQPVRAQYRAGRGYDTVSRMAAEESFQSAVNSLRDSLVTVAAPEGSKPVSAQDRYDYYRDACRFYLDRGLREKAGNSYRKLETTVRKRRLRSVDSLVEAVERYRFIRQLTDLEKRIFPGADEESDLLGAKMMKSFLRRLSTLGRRLSESGEQDSARLAFSICLREGYEAQETLGALRKSYGLDQLKNLEVPENASRVYLEANGIETMADGALAGGRLWAANDAFLRAAALYSAIPAQAGDLSSTARRRLNQIVKKMSSLPPGAILSEGFFQEGIESLEAGRSAEAVANLQISSSWGGEEKPVQEAITETEAYSLFARARSLYEGGEKKRSLKLFRKLVRNYPASSFAETAARMLELSRQEEALEANRLLPLLKTAYEAYFLGDKQSVFTLCDQILASSPDADFRDRAQLLIVLSWYQGGQSGYRGIAEIFRDLFDNRVLKKDGDELALKKRIDFFFGLKDPFPQINMDDFDRNLLREIELLQAAAGDLGPQEEAAEAIRTAEAEIEEAAEKIAEGQDRDYDMDEAEDHLDKAEDLLEEAKDSYADQDYEDSVSAAEDALQEAERARELAGRILGETEDSRQDARQLLEEAEDRADEVDNYLDDVKSEPDDPDPYRDRFDDLESRLDDIFDYLDEAREHFRDNEYEESMESSDEVISKSEDLTEDIEELEERIEDDEEEAEDEDEEEEEEPEE